MVSKSQKWVARMLRVLREIECVLFELGDSKKNEVLSIQHAISALAMSQLERYLWDLEKRKFERQIEQASITVDWAKRKLDRLIAKRRNLGNS